MERMSCLLMNSYRGPPTEFILPQTKKKQKGSTNKKERKETFYAASQIWGGNIQPNESEFHFH